MQLSAAAAPRPPMRRPRPAHCVTRAQAYEGRRAAPRCSVHIHARGRTIYATALCADSVASSRSAAKAHRNSRRRRWSAAKMPDVEHVEVVLANNDRVTLRVGDVFLKIDADQTRTDVEVEAMAMAPVPTPQILWRKPPALALAALPGTALGHLGEPSTTSSAAWAAAGAAARTLHDAPLP